MKETKPILPRRWQQEACTIIPAAFLAGEKVHFLVEAGVGSGKTMFAMFLHGVLHGRLSKIVCVAPQYAVKKGFVDTFALRGIQINHLGIPRKGDGFQGAALTYQGLLTPATQKLLARYVDENTIVFLDEPHHLLEDESSAWYKAAIRTLSHAGMLVLMTGTPYRAGTDKRIPFATYEEAGIDTHRLVPDYSYTYAESVRDGVCASVVFRFLEGNTIFRKGGKLVKLSTAKMMTAEQEKQLVKALLDPAKEFIPSALAEMMSALQEVKAQTANAAALVVAVDIKHATTIHNMLLRNGIRSVLVTGDDAQSQKSIQAFKKSGDDVMVSVKMVSEGTDIPRLKVLCYLSTISTDLFLMQVLGRITRKTLEQFMRQDCIMLIPGIPSYRRWAANIERGLRHTVIDKEDEEEEETGEDEGPPNPRKVSAFEVLSSTFTGQADLSLFAGIEPNMETPRADLVETERQAVQVLAQKVGLLWGKRNGKQPGEAISEIHRAANNYVGRDAQEEMSLEELALKREVISQWEKELNQTR